LHADTEELEAEAAELKRLVRTLTRATRSLTGRELVDAAAQIVSLEKLRARCLQQRRQGAMALRMWFIEFGLTPSARTRVRPASSAARLPARARKSSS
jgi:hypothetical protein